MSMFSSSISWIPSQTRSWGTALRTPPRHGGALQSQIGRKGSRSQSPSALSLERHNNIQIYEEHYELVFKIVGDMIGVQPLASALILSANWTAASKNSANYSEIFINESPRGQDRGA